MPVSNNSDMSITIENEWYRGDSLKVKLTADMLPADELVCEIEDKLRSLRSLYDEFVIVDLQNTNNSNGEYPLYFQTLRNRTYHKTNTYRVELGMKIDRGTIHYVKEEISLSELINEFRKICVKREKPNLSEWERRSNIYGDIETVEEDAAAHEELVRYRKLANDNWLKSIKSKDLLFAEYDALDYISENDCDPDYQSAAARLYEKYGRYDSLRSLFKVVSHNPVVAQINGEIELHGILGKPDYKKAFDYFTHAMTIGSLLAEYYIAKMYKYGLYVPQDYAKYENMIRSVYGTYKKYEIVVCPPCIALEMSKILQSESDIDAAVECCAKILGLKRKIMAADIGNVEYEDVGIMNQLYSMVDFDSDDMDLLDLLYVLQKPCEIEIILNRGKPINVRALYKNDRLMIKCGRKYYRDAVEFLRKHKVGGELLASYIFRTVYMEIV